MQYLHSLSNLFHNNIPVVPGILYEKLTRLHPAAHYAGQEDARQIGLQRFGIVPGAAVALLIDKQAQPVQ